jgi:hypothetical protein
MIIPLLDDDDDDDDDYISSRHACYRKHGTFNKIRLTLQMLYRASDLYRLCCALYANRHLQTRPFVRKGISITCET